MEGRWTGNYGRVFGLTHPEKLVVDLMVVSDTLITGTSHLQYQDGTYEHYRVRGHFRPGDSTVYFAEDSTIAVKLGALVDNCLGNYTLRLQQKGNKMRLEGRWRDNSDEFPLFRCPSTSVWLEKERPPANTEAPKPRDKNLERPAEIQSLVEISPGEMGSILIELRDNAQIDHDVVSVYVDDSLVIYKQKLTADPVVFTLRLSRSRALARIKMAAESMGSVPPCTALMSVVTPRNRHEVTLSSDFGQTGTLELFLKE